MVVGGKGFRCHGGETGTLAAQLLITLIAAIACALCLQACSSTEPEHVAARFGDHVITEDEVSAYTQAFREKNALQDDGQWKAYLNQSAQTVEVWRQEAIRALADRILIEDKAVELGLAVDAGAVDARIAQEKDEAGIAQDDEQAWADYLAARGQTPEQLRSDLEFSNLEQQVFKAELDFSDELRDEMCDDYISANFADQVVCRYSAIAVPLDSDAQARAYLRELEGLKGDKLTARFEELLAQVVDEGNGLQSGDLGWDFAYDEARIDPKLKLRKATLRKGELYQGVLKGTDALRIVLCTDWASFAQTPTYSSLKSESLKSTIEGMTMVSSWAAKCMQYLSDLEEGAHIQMTNMPADVDYAVS